jgi:choline dehydrogenase-like flavoprotein
VSTTQTRTDSSFQLRRDPRRVNGRGTGGPLKVSTVPDQNPLYDALFAASKAAGFKLNPDYNSEDQEGVVKTQTSIYKGRRMSVPLLHGPVEATPTPCRDRCAPPRAAGRREPGGTRRRIQAGARPSVGRAASPAVAGTLGIGSRILKANGRKHD